MGAPGPRCSGIVRISSSLAVEAVLLAPLLPLDTLSVLAWTTVVTTLPAKTEMISIAPSLSATPTRLAKLSTWFREAGRAAASRGWRVPFLQRAVFVSTPSRAAVAAGVLAEWLSCLVTPVGHLEAITRVVISASYPSTLGSTAWICRLDSMCVLLKYQLFALANEDFMFFVFSIFIVRNIYWNNMKNIIKENEVDPLQSSHYTYPIFIDWPPFAQRYTLPYSNALRSYICFHFPQKNWPLGRLSIFFQLK